MKEGLRSGVCYDDSDLILEEDVPLISLISKKNGSVLKKRGNSSGKRVTFDLSNVKKRSREVSGESEEDSDSDLLVSRSKIGRKSNGESRRRKRGLEAEEKSSGGVEVVACSEEDEVEKGKVEEDVVYVKRNRLDVFEYNEDDLLDFIAMKKESETAVSGNVGGKTKKKTSTKGKNRGIDVSDNEECEMDEAQPIGSFGKLKKKKSKISRKNVIIADDGLLDPANEKNVEEVDHSEAEWDKGIDVFDEEKCVTDDDEPNQSVGKSKVSPENSITAESGSLIPAKEKKVEEADCSELEENRSSGPSINSSRRQTRSSLNAMKIEKPAPPAVAKKLKSSKSLLASKIKQNQLRTVKKGTSSRLEKDEGRKESKKQQRSKARAKTEHNLPTELSQKGKNTEKQAIREQIQRIVEKAGWTIEYRRRQSKEYSDAVYVDLDGHAYWSCIKAYNALLKQYQDQDSDSEVIHCKNGFSFMPLPEELLNKLTRLTKSRLARENRMNTKSGKGVKKEKREVMNPKAEKGIKKEERASKENSSDKKHVSTSKDSRLKAGKTHRLIKKDRKAVKVKLERNSFKQNRKNAVKRPTSTHDTDEVDNDLQNGPSKRKTQGGFSLLVRDKEVNSDGDNYIAYPGKLSVLSWLIDSETLPLGGKVKYMNKRRTRKMLEGSVTRDGINCGCCSEVVSISEFETHAGSVIHQPSQNIFVEDGVPLFQCQIDAWNKQEESAHSGFYFVDNNTDDPNDDTCYICGDGGDLICCDGCPSTFHQSCLDIQVLPKGDWLCSDCCCKFCGLVGCSNGQEEDATISKLLTCSLCEEKYHEPCVLQKTDAPVDSDALCTPFCGKKCEELFERLKKLLGVKHKLEAGYSWTVIQRCNLESDTSICEFPQKVECNSKLALALNIMDECFMTTIDERSGINLLHNVVYNCGSNFKRLNYNGFYTFLLEKDDEIISAASIRIRGARFAEMPFIGTRYKYRRQGMCRRLLNAIELALGSIDIEKLIIPAVKELENTWTTIFGFVPIEESFKQEAKFLNMLVFPGVAMLQKSLLIQNSAQVALTSGPALMAIDLNKDENAKTNNVDSDGRVDLNSGTEVIMLDAPAEETLCSNSQPLNRPISETKSLLPETEENQPDKMDGVESDPKLLDETCLTVNGHVLDLNAPGDVNIPMDGFESDLHSSDITVVQYEASVTTESNQESSVISCNGKSANVSTRVTRSSVKMSLDLNKLSDGLESELEPNFQISSGSSSTSDLVQKALGDHDCP
ncbi:hypothetical protein ACHQM5_027525 [Ranunculus cassubicifolius]